MRFVLFISIFLLVMAAANVYIYRRFLRRVAPDYSKALIWVPVILMLGEIFFIVDLVTGIIPDSPTLYLINSAFIGITFMLFVVATFYDLIITVSGRVPFDQERRKVIKVIFDVTMIIAAMSYLLRGLSQGIKAPKINNVAVQIKDFPINGFTLVQLTDVHVGRTIKREFVEDLVTRTNDLAPDLVVITGDLVDLPIEHIKDDLRPLNELNAPCYFTLGNHEYFHGPESAVDYLVSLGIKPLLNDCVQIGKGKRRFNLVGINDLTGKRLGLLPHDVDKAFSKADVSRPCIVLAHQPKMIDLVDDRRCDLMLSGHTHGGQIFPFGLLVMMGQPYLAGLYQHAIDKQIFVSRGAGYWGPPLRILAPSEISRIVIHSA